MLKSTGSEQLAVEGLYEQTLDIFKAITLDDCHTMVKLISKVQSYPIK